MSRSRVSQSPMLPILHKQMQRSSDPRLMECLTATVLPPIPTSANTPAFPRAGRKGHRNHLHCYFDASRRLQIVVKFKHMLFPGMVTEYIQGALTIQLPDYYYSSHQATVYHPPTNIQLPLDITTVSHIAEYVFNWALLPTQRCFYSINSSETGHSWSPTADSFQLNNPDEDLIKVFQWSAQGRKSAAPKMMAFVQAPWVLGERDFMNFVKTKSMPQGPVTRDGEATQLTGKERLWAKIYDECTRNNCRWFVVTTYFHWAFGVFSEGFSAATITHELPSSRAGPSVSPLQGLFYWLSSSMQRPGTFVPDKFMETPYRPPTNQSQPRQHYTKYDVFQASASESCSDSEDENVTTYSRIPHNPASELSFQSTTITSTPGLLKNTHDDVPRQRGMKREAPKLPTPGDKLTKESVLPRRHWGSTFKADCVVRGRDELKKNQKMNNTIDWLDEGDLDAWGMDGYVPSAYGNARSHIEEVGFGREPPSPTESSDGSLFDTKVGQVVGKAMFAVAPKHPRRHYDV